MLPATAWLNCECDKGGVNAGEILSPTSRAILPTVAHAPAPPSPSFPSIILHPLQQARVGGEGASCAACDGVVQL